MPEWVMGVEVTCDDAVAGGKEGEDGRGEACRAAASWWDVYVDDGDVSYFDGYVFQLFVELMQGEFFKVD